MPRIGTSCLELSSLQGLPVKFLLLLEDLPLLMPAVRVWQRLTRLLWASGPFPAEAMLPDEAGEAPTKGICGHGE